MSDPATLHAMLKGLMRISRTPEQVRGVWRDNPDVLARIKDAEAELWNDLKLYGAQRTAELENGK